MPVKMGFWGAKWNSANPSCSLASRGRFVPLVGRWLVFSSFRYLPPPPSRPEGKGAVQARWTRCFGLFLLLLIVNGRRSQRPKSSVHGERAATFFFFPC